MKKVFTVLLVMILLVSPLRVFAAQEFDGSSYNSMSYMLIEMETGQVLAQNDVDRRVYPASTTKLMTALLLMEQKGLEGETTVGDEIVGLPNGSSLMGLEKGETVTIKDLLYGLLLSSGNDAANTIAVYVSGSVDSFCQLMNQRAGELGMVGTHFINPYGGFINQSEEYPVPEEQLGIHHYTAAADMAKLAVEVAKYPELLEAVGTKQYTLSVTNMHTEERQIKNSNLLMQTPNDRPDLEEYVYPYANGMKTGTVNNIQVDGKTIATYGSVVASAEKDGLSLIALIFGDESQKETDYDKVNSYERWILAAGLFDFAFENYKWLDMNSYIKPISQTEQLAGGTLQITSQPSPDMPKRLVDAQTANALAGGSAVVEATVTLHTPLPMPINAGAVVGTVQYSLNGQELYTTDALAGNTIGEVPVQESAQGTAVPSEENKPEKEHSYLWLLWIIIPGGFVGTLFIMRFINLSRRKRRRMQRRNAQSQYRRRRR